MTRAENRGTAAAPPLAIEAADLLDRAAERIDSGWTQGAEALNAAGRHTAPNAAHAVAWCAGGALTAAEYDTGLRFRHRNPTVTEDRYAEDVRGCAIDQLGALVGPAIRGWNDRRGQRAENVAGAMRIAAESLRERAS